MIKQNSSSTTAIIGGGFSGAMVAARLAAHLSGKPGDAAGRIVVFEPRRHLGRGLAYDTDNAAHRVNVPADRMSIDWDDDNDFVDWIARNDILEGDPAALAQDGRLYPGRAVFGRYVSDFIAPFLESGAIKHERSRVVQVRREHGQWIIRAENGGCFRADFLVIATSHPAPKAPGDVDRVLHGHPRYICDTTVPNALDAIRTDDRVLVMGAGLTAADAIATLDACGHKGPITFFSRRGLRSRGHCLVAQEPFGDFVSHPLPTATALLRQVRGTIRDAGALGLSWHAVFDALRSQGGQIWRNLPLKERLRLVRHLRPFWDAHRFRVAPQVDAVVDRALLSGRLRLLAGSLSAIERDGETIRATLRKRRDGGYDHTAYDAVVVTTGPAHGGILSSQTWLSELADAGLVTADATALGLACDDDSRAIGRDGRAVADLFISGPLARGTFGELMGLPQVNDHTVLVANGLHQALQEARHQHSAGPGLRTASR